MKVYMRENGHGKTILSMPLQSAHAAAGWSIGAEGTTGIRRHRAEHMSEAGYGLDGGVLLRLLKPGVSRKEAQQAEQHSLPGLLRRPHVRHVRTTMLRGEMPWQRPQLMQ
ncbi:MAG: hypothetical protein LBU07_07440 [Coriobacteriales bacterium]|jgi:hypothetical protein|nr:hypothetical protein [Coriobacteriales bacterium]